MFHMTARLNMRDSGTNHQEGHDTSAFFIKVTRDDYEDDLSADPPYDPFDSDCDLEKPTPKPARSKSREPGRLTREAYVGMCQCLKTIPLREVSKQFGKEKMCLRKAILGPRDLKAISTALLSDTYCRVLDLSGIFMDLKMVQYMCMMLNENITIRELNVADNRLSGEGLKCMAHAIKENGVIKTLNVSGNGLRDSDSIHIADIIANGTSLQRLNISHNELREDAGKIIGDVLGPNKNLRELDLSWNHIRCRGAIDLAKCLEKNTCLVKLNVGWNGFAYGGSLAMGETLATNTTLIDLDISCNRIHPPALIQLLKGLVKNKTLIKLNLSDNPIPVPFTGVILAAIRDSPNMVLTYLDLDGIIVDEEFLKILEVLESRRLFEVRYEAALPLNQYKRNRILEEFDKKDDVFSLDPIEMLYTLKEKMRAVDFFSKLDKEKKNTVTKVELHKLFKESGIPVTSASVDKAMEFIDFKRDGVIDLEEFIEADKKIKRHARAKAAKRAEQATLSTEKENRFSQSFRGADFNGTTSRVELTVDKEGRSIVEAAKTKDTLAPLPEKGPPLRNGLLKPLSARRRSSVSHLYGNDRRSSIGGNLFTNWSIPDEFDFD